MSAYVNSVSDKLYIFSYSDRQVLCICSAANEPKWIEELDNNSPAVLNNAHFSEQHLIHCNSPFVLCPSTESSDASQYYALNYGMAEVETKPLDEDILMAYHPSHHKQIEDLLVKPSEHLDFEVLHRYKGGLSRSNAIFFSVADRQMLIRTYSAQRLILANRFAVENKDEIFYFIMFAAEQLKLDISSIHFEFMGTKEQYSVYEELFKNYLPKLLHLDNYLISDSKLPDSQKELFAKEWLAAVAIQCV